MTPDVTDAVTLENFPVVVVPQSGTLGPAKRNGTRYLVAREGLYWELTTGWLRAVQPAVPYVTTIEKVGARPAPYGSVTASVSTHCSCPPKDLWAEFLACAREVLPNEAAALLIWNHQTDTWRLAMRTAANASSQRIDYIEPRLDEDEVAVVDVHSHGEAKAFFSGLDDIDDWGGIKIAVVFGNVHRGRPEVASRLVLMDRLIPMRMTEAGWFVVKEETP